MVKATVNRLYILQYTLTPRKGRNYATYSMSVRIKNDAGLVKAE
jgi:hypothetical protein